MTPENCKVVSDFLCNALLNESQTTRKILAALPQDKMDYLPNEKAMSAGALAWHIAVADHFFLTAVATGDFPKFSTDPTPATVAEILTYYDANIPPMLDKIKLLSPEQTAKIMTFAIFTFPAVVSLNLANGHSIHHRGQLSAYLRAMGAKVPSIYGPSADDKGVEASA
jgi:uncharacterized damage-inducible protein DinB